MSTEATTSAQSIIDDIRATAQRVEEAAGECWLASVRPMRFRELPTDVFIAVCEEFKETPSLGTEDAEAKIRFGDVWITVRTLRVATEAEPKPDPIEVLRAESAISTATKHQ